MGAVESFEPAANRPMDKLVILCYRGDGNRS